MKPLLLSGFGIDINVNGRKLVIYKHQTNEKLEFYPHQIPYDNVIIDGYYGNVSFEALRWLSKHGITLSLLNWNGNLLSVTSPREPISGRLKIKQYETYENNVKRYEIASKIIETKINKSKELLLTLSNYHNELKKNEIPETFDRELRNFNDGYRKITLFAHKVLKVTDTNGIKQMKKQNKIELNREKIESPENPVNQKIEYGHEKQNKTAANRDKIENKQNKTENRIGTKIGANDCSLNGENKEQKQTIKNLMAYEGRIANTYWITLSKIFNKLYPEFNFKRRNNSLDSHNRNASDYVNAMLNYGYAILESVIRKDINVIGLDPDIGFLHEITPSKQPLVYDLQELYRWLIDLSVIQVLEDKKLKKNDFIVTENYHIRLRESAARQLLEKITPNFNKRAEFRGKMHTYDNILLENVRNLAKSIETDNDYLEFEIPDIKIDRNDNTELRNQIMSITPEERKRLGINKSTLWYRQKAIKEGKKIKIYETRKII
jgi:CRISPR-associated protein Cas1